MAISKKKKKEKKILERTINEDLFKSWQIKRRFKDPALIAERFNVSRPTVDNALNFGHVKGVPEVVGYINTFFDERDDLESEKGKKYIEESIQKGKS